MRNISRKQAKTISTHRNLTSMQEPPIAVGLLYAEVLDVLTYPIFRSLEKCMFELQALGWGKGRLWFLPGAVAQTR